MANLIQRITAIYWQCDQKVPVCEIAALDPADGENTVVGQQRQPRGFCAIVERHMKRTRTPAACDGVLKLETLSQDGPELPGNVAGPVNLRWLSLYGDRPFGAVGFLRSAKHANVAEASEPRRGHNGSCHGFRVAVEPRAGTQVFPVQ